MNKLLNKIFQSLINNWYIITPIIICMITSICFDVSAITFIVNITSFLIFLLIPYYKIIYKIILREIKDTIQWIIDFYISLINIPGKIFNVIQELRKVEITEEDIKIMGNVISKTIKNILWIFTKYFLWIFLILSIIVGMFHSVLGFAYLKIIASYIYGIIGMPLFIILAVIGVLSGFILGVWYLCLFAAIIYGMIIVITALIVILSHIF